MASVEAINQSLFLLLHNPIIWCHRQSPGRGSSGFQLGCLWHLRVSGFVHFSDQRVNVSCIITWIDMHSVSENNQKQLSEVVFSAIGRFSQLFQTSQWFEQLLIFGFNEWKPSLVLQHGEFNLNGWRVCSSSGLVSAVFPSGLKVFVHQPDFHGHYTEIAWWLISWFVLRSLWNDVFSIMKNRSAYTVKSIYLKFYSISLYPSTLMSHAGADATCW